MSLFKDRWWEADEIAVDVETTGLSRFDDRVFGVAIAWPTENGIKSLYFDVRKRYKMYEEFAEKILLAKRVVNHAIKFDLHMLATDEIHLDLHRTECTLVRASLIDENRMTYSLDALSRKYLKAEKVSDVYEALAAKFGGAPTRKAQIANLQFADEELVDPYARRDAELALQLWYHQRGVIEKENLHQIWALEHRTFRPLFLNERRGIKVDVEMAVRAQEELTLKIDQTQKELDTMAGFKVNCNPSNSIIELFKPKLVKEAYELIDGTIAPMTGKGKPSITADVLQSMKHPAAGLILGVRRMLKTRDTFLGAHILGHERDGRVHPNINQTRGETDGGTRTGRLAYHAPALGQIPSRDVEIASKIRPIFVPDDGQQWSYGDLDQHELRVFHHYANNADIIRAYADNADLDGHQAVADMLGIPRNPPKGGGINAKQTNLAMVFNMGGGQLAEDMGLPWEWNSFTSRDGEQITYKKAGAEAQKFINDYYDAVPGIKELSESCRTVAKQRGYIKTFLGRHCHFPGGHFAHKAPAYLYQGSAGDLNKENICMIHDYLESEAPDSHFLLNVHDEYSMSMEPDGNEVKHLCAIKDLIQDRKLRVPIRIDFSTPSNSWWDATQAGACTK